jgi:hypothetical protein
MYAEHLTLRPSNVAAWKCCTGAACIRRSSLQKLSCLATSSKLAYITSPMATLFRTYEACCHNDLDPTSHAIMLFLRRIVKRDSPPCVKNSNMKGIFYYLQPNKQYRISAVFRCPAFHDNCDLEVPNFTTENEACPASNIRIGLAFLERCVLDCKIKCRRISTLMVCAASST